MARIRTIKPEFWKHENLSALPEAVHMLAAALLNYADDEGYFNANDKLVRAECFPLREPSVSVHDGLTQLVKAGYLRLGTGADGKRYGHVVTFEQHQRINRKTPSKIKAMQIAWDATVSTHTQLTEGSHLEGNGREGKGIPPSAGAAAPQSDPKKELFARARQVLGRESGGLTTKLLRSCGPDEDDPKTIAKARARIEDASTKHDAAEWLGRVLSPRKGAPVLTDAGTPWPDGQL
jgi:hypothetical protein